MTYLVRLAGAESNIVQTIEADALFTDQGVLTFYLRGSIVYMAGLARLVDVRLSP